MDLKLVEVEKNNPKLLSNRQECSSYTLLDNQDRNIKYTGGSSDLCDDGISSGWYRFGGAAGSQLSTICVPRKDTSKRKCHTDAVSWLNGAHPSVSDGKVTREVCFSWDGNCCRWNKNIEVINCGLFYIYKLVSSPVCSGRYCGTDVCILS
ncbi:Hypothetical predicted protein [Paramuricea clavata]|uniref:UMOD/GP2/OIT3-like D8C domain-containing protein n=1 Tax=Paramuricea clavata TaxID=317549 RepID=A0A6S7K0L0_PARCT|nr:Hypothetical predicted protein [Paramuricea clavata]